MYISYKDLLTLHVNFVKMLYQESMGKFIILPLKRGGNALTDQRTLAYINLYAVFGALENLCELDEEARALLKGKKPVTIGIEVKGGPSATLTFKNSRCRLDDGCRADCDVKLPFSSCEKFNGLFDNTTTPIPSKGFTKIFFLLKSFVPLTDILTKYLRPSDEDMADSEFFRKSTLLTMYVVAVAISQIANQDEIGRFSAKHITDGDIKMGIKGGPYVTIRAKNNRLLTLKKESENPRALMEFASIELAAKLFSGQVNALNCIGRGEIIMGGMISSIDNINRILDRVSLYLS